MSDFRHKNPPRNYFARREQWRLLGLVMGLGLVVILMSELRDPDNREAWFGWLQQNTQPAEGAAPEATKIDNLAPTPQRASEIPGSFIARAEPAEAEADTSGKYFPGVKSGHLEEVRDNAPFGSAGSEESLAWLNLLEIVRTAEQETLDEASTGRATYAQLTKQSSDYRGKLVTVMGTARRANRLAAPKNDLGIEKYRRVWIFPDDNPTSPLVAYVLSLPKDFPMGMQIRADVELTGFFFKQWSYLSGNPATGEQQLRVAPVLLARTLTWQKPGPPKPPPPTDPLSLALLVGVALLVAVAVVVYALRRTQGEARTPADLPETIPPVWDTSPPSDAGMPLDASPEGDTTKQPE